MNFTPIDLQSWPRSQMYCYFSKIAPTGYSMTVPVDVTGLRQAVHEAGLKFFPVYLWLVTKSLNSQAEFKVAEEDGVLGFYDTLTPLYASFHGDDHTFSFMWTEYTGSLPQFYQAYIENQERFGPVHGLLCQPQTPPPGNAYTISAIPWVPFSHFAVHSYGDKPYFLPSVEAGKFFEQDHRIFMPLSLTCHHATTDGYHVARFLESLQDDISGFQRYL